MLEVAIEEQVIRIGQRFAVSFQRTLRIPDDGRTYPLPPGFGAFPILKVEDYRDSVPPMWLEQGGAFIPMYQREALWLGFHAASWKPNAVKIAVGRVNAISGEPDDDRLHAKPQDYVVCPDQPWLDGINTGHGSIRQFIVMPLGLGYTVEASVTGAEKFGGIQITVFEPKPRRFPDKPPIRAETGPVKFAQPKPSATEGQHMGIGAGGAMKQKIYPDPYGIDVWDQYNYGRIVIHIANSAQFLDITGMKPPSTPVDANTYTEYGLPWFDLYDETKGDVSPPEALAEVKTIAERDKERADDSMEDTSIDVSESQIRKLRKDGPGADRDSAAPDSPRRPRKGEQNET